MIVRILGEGQFRLDDDLIDALNELDTRLMEYLDDDDEEQFSALLHQMANLVHERGEPLADDELLPSDAILPPEDATLNEILDLLGAEGLIPG